MNTTITSLEKKHFPVMLNEVIETCLSINKDLLIVDCTFGGGGYSKGFLKLPKVNVNVDKPDLSGLSSVLSQIPSSIESLDFPS